MKLEKMAISTEEDIVTARQLGRRAAANLGFSLVDQTRITAAISEITRNALQYAGSGEFSIEVTTQDSQQKEMKIVISDNGPGIADIEEAMQNGFTTSNGLGAGLAATKQLVDVLDIQSRPGQGTTVTLIMKKHIPANVGGTGQDSGCMI